ncbi:MAG TPA: hypothetical protein EYH09_00300 [Candidatus Nanopusillus sp.]|nr:hypothetical protein [Candidatus Nanopusillus sp.]HIP90531.1 hypothetical protein [Candidatus Nanopusillus sp.]
MVALILIPLRGFHDQDLLELIDILKDKVYVATENREVAIGKLGTKVLPDFSFKEILYINSNPFDKLIIIADEGWKRLDLPEVKTIIAGFLYGYKTVIIISLAPVLLAQFGFLAGKIVTYNNKEFPQYEPLLIKYGVKVVDFPVFKDGYIISARGRESVKMITKYL